MWTGPLISCAMDSDRIGGWRSIMLSRADKWLRKKDTKQGGRNVNQHHSSERLSTQLLGCWLLNLTLTRWAWEMYVALRLWIGQLGPECCQHACFTASQGAQERREHPGSQS